MSDSLSLHELGSPTPSSMTAINDEPAVRDKQTSHHASAHAEHHSSHGDFLRDAIIGFSDGLTVPFALCAALSTLDSSKVVISGGLAELFAGSLSMGIGAVLASLNEKTHYAVEQARERREVKEEPEVEAEEIYEIFWQYGIGRPAARGVVEALKVDEDKWVKVNFVCRRHVVLHTLTACAVHDGFRAQPRETVNEESAHRRRSHGNLILSR